MTVMIEPRVLELLLSKVCHDLVSPVGAVNNGIELMRELGPDMASDAIDLIESSIGQASMRLKMFRLVYGVAGSDSMPSMADIKTTFEDWMRGGRSAINWEGDIDLDDQAKGFGKILLNLLILASECNTGDGSITTNFENDKTIIIMDGKRPGFHKGMNSCLQVDFPVEDLNPRLVHSYITGVFAKNFGFSIEDEKTSDTQMIFTLRKV